MDGLERFLMTARSSGDLRIALDVLREFKALESASEYYATPFIAWGLLERFEDYLEILVERAGADVLVD
jgi:hypothetical protein